MTSNNVTEVEAHFGIEAAASVLRELTGEYVSDFMARTGRVLSFMKNSIEVQNKGLLASMSFERPKDDVKNNVKRRTTGASVYGSIITGDEIHSNFEIITKCTQR